MKQPEKSSRKHMGDLRKHSISEKTRSDNTPSFKEEQYTALLCRDMKSLGRKYAQENVFKGKGEHHEIVISDELVRNSRQFRMLREKIQMREAVFSKEFGELSQTRGRLKQEVAEIKSSSYNSKLALWELKNQILELKGILNDEEEEGHRLERELALPPQQQYYAEEQYRGEEGEEEVPRGEEEYEMEGQLRVHSEEGREGEGQQEIDIRMVASQLNPHSHPYPRINPESMSPLKQEEEDCNLD